MCCSLNGRRLDRLFLVILLHHLVRRRLILRLHRPPGWRGGLPGPLPRAGCVGPLRPERDGGPGPLGSSLRLEQRRVVILVVGVVIVLGVEVVVLILGLEVVLWVLVVATRKKLGHYALLIISVFLIIN